MNHHGRTVHPEYSNGLIPISSSCIAARVEVYTPKGKKPCIIPKEATYEDIKQIITYFKKSAEFAKIAGFDGV
jgi:2,4-dienoyl-CoA reductase-like NADH-dependent reductase (Old Yellow Enzyme family)